jgi:hypothetical protein
MSLVDDLSISNRRDDHAHDDDADALTLRAKSNRN